LALARRLSTEATTHSLAKAVEAGLTIRKATETVHVIDPPRRVVIGLTAAGHLTTLGIRCALLALTIIGPDGKPLTGSADEMEGEAPGLGLENNSDGTGLTLNSSSVRRHTTPSPKSRRKRQCDNASGNVENLRTPQRERLTTPPSASDGGPIRSFANKRSDAGTVTDSVGMLIQNSAKKN
jgi:hypothetical protein